MAFIDIFNFKKYFSRPSDAQVARYGHVNALYDALQQPAADLYEKHIRFYSTDGISIESEVVYSNVPDLYRDLRVIIDNSTALINISIGNNLGLGNNNLPLINYSTVAFYTSPYSDSNNGYDISYIQEPAPYVFLSLTNGGIPGGTGCFSDPEYNLWVKLTYFKDQLPTT
jgi:hypothetical protein